jgi:PPOX class probable F420-dependent enzyme
MPKSLHLSRDEVWQTLEGAHTGIFTSLRRDGVPIALPVWFVVIDQRVYVSGPAHRKKFARVRRDPRVSFLVESGERWAQLRGVHLTGRARIVTEPDLLARVSDALHAKYDAFRTPRPAMPDSTRVAYETEATTIEIMPDERILSWDNGRLELAE